MASAKNRIFNADSIDYSAKIMRAKLPVENLAMPATRSIGQILAMVGDRHKT
jgi:hypothetical protein